MKKITEKNIYRTQVQVEEDPDDNAEAFVSALSKKKTKTVIYNQNYSASNVQEAVNMIELNHENCDLEIISIEKTGTVLELASDDGIPFK